MKHYNKTNKLRNFLKGTAIGIGILAGAYTLNEMPNDADKIFTIKENKEWKVADWYRIKTGKKDDGIIWREYLCQTLDNAIEIDWREYLNIVRTKNKKDLEGEILFPIFEIPGTSNSDYLAEDS